MCPRDRNGKSPNLVIFTGTKYALPSSGLWGDVPPPPLEIRGNVPPPPGWKFGRNVPPIEKISSQLSTFSQPINDLNVK